MALDLLNHEIEFAARTWPNKIAIVSPRGDLSFQQIETKASKLAGALQFLGLSDGDRLAILGQNSADYIVWHYAAAKVGIILHVLNTRLAIGELEWMINNAESAALITDSDFIKQAKSLQKKCTSLRLLIGMAGEKSAEYATDELAERNLSYQTTKVEQQNAALMIYTSGTTGRPKGALQSHGGSLLADQLTLDAVKITANDTYLALMPFFHQAGLIRTRATILAGGRCVIPGKVEAAATADAICEHGVTFTMIASPQQNLAIREKLNKDGVEEFKHLRIILGGGGMGERAAKSIQSMCDSLGCSYFGVYGQTETTGPAVFITGPDVFERPASCGKPFPAIDIAIWNDSGIPLPSGSVGEIVVRGPITARYWRNDAANEALYEGDWLHTGDLGYLDKEGFLYFKGRLKELIKTGAENVYPREVEAVIEQHQNIADVAIIGLPDKAWGEIVCAAIVTRNNKAFTLEEIKSFCRDKIGAYKIPKYVIQVDNIPRNHTGKILRQPLIQLAESSRKS